MISDSKNNQAEIPLLRSGSEADGVDLTPKWAKNSLFPYYLLPKNKELESLSKKLKKLVSCQKYYFGMLLSQRNYLVGILIDR